MNKDVITMHWRGLDLTIKYDHELWDGGKDRVIVNAAEPFYKGGPDYLCKFIGPFAEPVSEDGIRFLAETWLDEWLERCYKLRSADVERRQLSLF